MFLFHINVPQSNALVSDPSKNDVVCDGIRTESWFTCVYCISFLNNEIGFVINTRNKKTDDIDINVREQASLISKYSTCNVRWVQCCITKYWSSSKMLPKIFHLCVEKAITYLASQSKLEYSPWMQSATNTRGGDFRSRDPERLIIASNSDWIEQMHCVTKWVWSPGRPPMEQNIPIWRALDGDGGSVRNSCFKSKLGMLALPILMWKQWNEGEVPKNVILSVDEGCSEAAAAVGAGCPESIRPADGLSRQRSPEAQSSARSDGASPIL